MHITFKNRKTMEVIKGYHCYKSYKKNIKNKHNYIEILFIIKLGVGFLQLLRFFPP
jgi:hypothetical protein